MIREMLDEYQILISSNLDKIIEYPFLYYRCEEILKDKKILEVLKDQFYKYLESTKNELELYNYIIKKNNKMYEDDIFDVLEEVDILQYHKDEYIEEVFDKIDFAISMEDKSRFYLPKQRYEMYLTKEKLEELKIHLKGFNDENLKRFLIEEQVYKEEKLTKFLEKRKLLNINIDNNIDIFGTLITVKNDQSIELKGILVPEIKDAKSMIINVHELIHAELLTNDKYKEKIDIFTEEIPILYENIYKLKNDFVNIDVHETELSKKLIKEYKGESFEEQVEKYKYYVEKQ